MKFRTEIRPVRPPFLINGKDKIFTAGSCFARHIGNYLQDRFLNIRVNPFGTLFNPHSVLNLLLRTAENRPFTEHDIFFDRNQWKSFELYSVFNRSRKDDFLEEINGMIRSNALFLNQTSIMIITYGTARVFVEKSSGKIVANCHKIPADRFEKRMLTTDEILDFTEKIYHTGKYFNSEMKFIFSVSPVRYLQDGMPANSLSKARLLDAVISFSSRHPSDTYYFPAYEIFIDDLRDYRFYDTDMIHPGAQGVAYVTEIFSDLFFDNEGKQMLREAEELHKMSNHKIFDPTAPEAKAFSEKLLRKRNELKNKYPGLNL